MYRIKVTLVSMYTLLIGYVSLADDEKPGSIVPDLNHYGVPDLDKLAHIGAYAVFILLISLFFGIHNRKNIITTALLIGFYGLMLEVLQHWVPSRQASLFDFLSDIIGLGAGVILLNLYQRVIHQKAAKRTP